MKIFRIPFLYLILCATMYSNGYNSLSNGQFDQIKYLEGLSSNFVFDIEKDNNGKIWVATQNGLTVIDGKNFIKYGTSDNLPSSDINQIAIYKNSIYIATSKDGLYNFNGQSFQKIEAVQGNKISHMSSHNNELFISTDLGNMLFDGTKTDNMGWGFPNSKIVNSYMSNGKTWYASKNTLIEKSGDKFKVHALTFPSKNIYAQCLIFKNKDVYIGTNNGLYLWKDEQQLQLKKKKINVTSLEFFNDEVMIVGTKEGIYAFQNNNFIPINYISSIKTNLNNLHIKDIKVVNSHEVWYSTFGEGIILHDPTTFFNIGEELNFNVGGMVYDAESFNNKTYIATNNGLYILESDLSFNHYDKSNGLSSNTVFDIDIDKNGLVYMATPSGLSIYNGIVFNNYTKNEGLPSNLVLSLSVDKNINETIWLGTKNAGLIKFDGKIFTTYSKKDGLATNWIQDIEQFDNGTLVLACYGSGITTFDGKVFKNHNKGLTDQRVVDVAIDDKNQIWIGTESSGVGFFKDNAISMITSLDGLGHNEIFSLYEDSGKIWVGTFGGGVSYLNNNQWFTLNSLSGIIGNTIGAITRLSEDRILIGTNNGLTIFTNNQNNIDLKISNISSSGSNISIQNIDDEYITGYPDERFSIYVNPLFYNTGVSNLVYRYRIKRNSSIGKWSNFSSYPTIEQVDGYKETVIPYDSLIIGQYTLQIQAANDRLNSSNIIELPFLIIRKWYLNPITAVPFWLLVIGLGFLVFNTFVKYRRQKIKTKELQDAEILRKNAELEEATLFQQSLLPKKMPASDNYDIIGFQKTATEVGGDYFDFIKGDNGRIIAICGDATGHGLTSGNVVAITKTALSSISLDNPVAILDTLNKTLLKMNIGLNRMCLNIADIYNDKINFSSAGMPPAYFYSKKDNILKEILVGALPLGSFSKSIHSSEEIIFKDKGDMLFLLSDGLPEAENSNGEMIGYPKTEQKLKDLIDLNLEDTKNELIKFCDEWLNGADLQDDMTFVIIKKK